MKTKKILQFIKSNKEGIIGITGMLIAQVAFTKVGYNMGCKDGWENGAKEVISDIHNMKDDTYKNVKEHLINNEGYTIIDTDDK